MRKTKIGYWLECKNPDWWFESKNGHVLYSTKRFKRFKKILSFVNKFPDESFTVIKYKFRDNKVSVLCEWNC